MGILLRNWHLKLSAILLATVLYTGLVFSGSFGDEEIQVRIEQVNQPPNSFVLNDDLGLINVSYRAPQEMLDSVVAGAFSARVDLSDYDLTRAPEPQVLDVEVISLNDDVEVLDVEPDQVQVRLDRLDQRTVPIEVAPGALPEHLEIREIEVSDEEVTVRGPASVLNQVDRAVALVSIDASGIDFDRPVDLQPVDIEGQPVGVGQLQLSPSSVAVRIDVEEVEETRTVPVRPQIVGDPAAGYALETLSVEPSTVTLVGLPEALEPVTEVMTEEVNVAGASSELVVEAAIVLPDGVRLADGEEVATVIVSIVPSVASRTFVVGVTCTNAGENACLPGLDQVAVTLSGPGETLSGLSATALTPTIDVGGLGPGSHDVSLSIGGLPDGVELIGISPSSIPVTIQAPSTPAPTSTPEP